MNHSLTPEIAMAIQKGENNYAQLLFDMEIEQPLKTGIITVADLSDNQKLGYDNLERRLRGAA